MVGWSEVIRTFASEDQYLQHTLANGEWTIVLSKNSIFAMRDLKNAKTLIFYKVRSNGNLYYRYYIVNRVLTKSDIYTLVDKLRGYKKDEVITTSFNVKKFMKLRARKEHEKNVNKAEKIESLIRMFERYIQDYKAKLRSLRGKRGRKYTQERKRLREQIKACERHIERLREQLKKIEKKTIVEDEDL